MDLSAKGISKRLWFGKKMERARARCDAHHHPPPSQEDQRITAGVHSNETRTSKTNHDIVPTGTTPRGGTGARPASVSKRLAQDAVSRVGRTCPRSTEQAFHATTNSLQISDRTTGVGGGIETAFLRTAAAYGGNKLRQQKKRKRNFYHQFTTLFHAPARFLSLGLLIPRLLFFCLNGFGEGCVVLSCFSSLNELWELGRRTQHRCTRCHLRRSGLGATPCF